MAHAAFLAANRGVAPSFQQVGGKLRVTLQGRPDLGHAEHELRSGSFAATVRPTLTVAERRRVQGASKPVVAERPLPERSTAMRDIVVGVVVGVLVMLIVRSV